MANLRELLDGKALHGGAQEDVFNHLKNVKTKKAELDTETARLHSKIAPTRTLLNLIDQEHPLPGSGMTDPMNGDPNQMNGPGGPGGMGQGLENQDDLARTGQMVRPKQGGVTPNMTKGQPGKPAGDGNKPLRTPDSNQARGKAPQRSSSGQKPAGKTTKGTEKGGGGSKKKVTVEFSSKKKKMSASKKDCPCAK